MSRSLSSLFALYTLTPGRRIYALGHVRKRVQPLGLFDLITAIDDAIAHDRATLELDAARQARSSSQVRARDVEVDRTLVTIERLLAHFAAGNDPTAASLLATLFPISLAHHIRLPVVEQAAANERVLDVLEGKPHAAWLDAHGVTPLIVELRTAHDAFVTALHARDGEAVPSWDEVKSAREQGQEMYLQIVARIVTTFLADSTTRDELLEPIRQQDQLIQAHRRRRRQISEVDPDSGKPLDAETESEAESETEAEADPIDDSSLGDGGDPAPQQQVG